MPHRQSVPIELRVQEAPLDPLLGIATHCQAGASVGAVVSFVGLMRDFNQGEPVSGMTLEHYPGMTEKALRAIVDEATQRWDLLGVTLLHRVGDIQPTEPIVLVAVSSAHRAAAFRACEFIIDYLKTRAPFWKKERLAGGEARWVEDRETDQDAAARW